MIPPPPTSTLFPYTTLFRSSCRRLALCASGRTSLRVRMPIAMMLANEIGKVGRFAWNRSEEHTSELQSLTNLVCRLLLEKKKKKKNNYIQKLYKICILYID